MLALLAWAGGAQGEPGADSHIRELLAAGAAREAVAVFDALPMRAHESVLAAGGDDLRINLALARYIVGDPPEDARALLTDGLFALGRTRLDCPRRGATPLTLDERLNGRCGAGNPLSARMAMLELVLNRPADDPYGFLEQTIGQSLSMGPLPDSPRKPLTSLWSQALCKKLDEPTYARLRALLCTTPAPEPYVRSESPLPDFAEAPLPPALRTVRPGYLNGDAIPWPKNLGPVPQGFIPARLEIRGTRATAIIRSWNLDPTENLYAGNYWVLLSHDGGRHWSKPLFTGLISYFPYVVTPTSHLALQAGDALHVEVQLRQLDNPGSPGPHFTLRKADDLYLTIPLATLTRDSDADGLTDLLEAALLLNPHNRDTDRDGIPDGADMMPNVPQAPADVSAPAQAYRAVLQRIAQRAPAGPLGAPGAPVIMIADPADVAGLRLDYPLLLYTQNAFARLYAGMPNVHTVGFTLTFDRSGKRAFATWSQYAGGGSIGLILEKDGWHLRDLSRWMF